jgi:hypothetical protein
MISIGHTVAGPDDRQLHRRTFIKFQVKKSTIIHGKMEQSVREKDGFSTMGSFQK